jgi:uncharacterized MAPEG superfamily protein
MPALNMSDLHYLVLSAILAWVMLLTASVLRSHGWTHPGIRVMLGNRDAVPEPTPAAARADRAAQNMVENLVLFTAFLAAARLAGANGAPLTLGASIFFWARLAYFPLYVAGVRYLRTVAWALSLGGMCLIAAQVLSQ